jgi:hypothetical protein
MPESNPTKPQPKVCAEFEKTLQKCIFEHDDETCHTIFKNIHIGFYSACIKKDGKIPKVK